MTRNPLLPGLLAAIALGGACTAAQTHPQAETHDVAPVVVTAPRPRLPTDAPLRSGMVEVQNALVAEYFAACAQGPSQGEYDRLSAAVERQSDALALQSRGGGASADALSGLAQRLHRSAKLLRSPHDQRAGVAELVSALRAYASEFDHPAWRPAAPRPRIGPTDDDGAAREAGGPRADEAAFARASRREMCRRVADAHYDVWPWRLR